MPKLSHTSLKEHWFSPSGQDDEPAPALFKIHSLPPEQFEQVSLLSDQRDGQTFITPLGISTALRYSLKGWTDYNYENGLPVPFSLSEIPFIPTSYRAEIALEIIRVSTLSGEQQKNSVSQ